MANTKKKQTLVPKLRFPEYRDEKAWEELPLRKLAERITDKVGESKLTPVSITAGQGFVNQAEKFGRDISGAQYKNYIRLRKGEFAYNKGNSKRFPQGCIYQLNEFDEVAAPNAFISFRLKKGLAPQFFQGLFDKNEHGVQLARFITSGARSDGLLNISPGDFFSIKLPVPSSAEQQKIADCLTSLDAVITGQQEKLDALKAHKKGLMQQLFPRPGKSTPELRFPEFQDTGDWVTEPLEELAEYENGKAYEKHIVEKGRYIVVNSRFISTDGGVIKYTNEDFLTAKANDVLMVLSDLPNGRALAKCYFVKENNRYAVNQRICRLVPRRIYGKFLYYSLDRHPHLLAYDDGLNQTHLSKGGVTNCPLIVPPQDAEQQRIADCLSSLDELITAQTEKAETLKRFKEGLMQQLFPSPEEDDA